MEKGDPPPSYNSVVQSELRRRIKPNNNKTDDITPGESSEPERPGSVILTSQNNNNNNNNNNTNIINNDNTNTNVSQDSDKQSAAAPIMAQNFPVPTDSTPDLVTSVKPSAPSASLLTNSSIETIQPEINEKLDHIGIVNNPSQSTNVTTTTELIEPHRLNLWERFRKGLEDFAFFVIQLLD